MSRADDLVALNLYEKWCEEHDGPDDMRSWVCARLREAWRREAVLENHIAELIEIHDQERPMTNEEHADMRREFGLDR